MTAPANTFTVSETQPGQPQPEPDRLSASFADAGIGGFRAGHRPPELPSGCKNPPRLWESPLWPAIL